MKLLFFCIDVNPGTLFTIAVIVDMIYSASLLGTNIKLIIDHGKHDKDSERKYLMAWTETIISGLIGLLAIYAFFIYVTYRTISAHPQIVYYNLKNIILLIQVIILLIIGILLLPLLPIIFIVYLPTFLLYSWNNQLRRYSEGEDKSEALIVNDMA